MDVKKLDMLLKVVNIGSFKKAAEELNYSQSGLLYIINSLEEEIGMPILNRDYKGVSLTHEGQILEPFIHELIEKNNLFEEMVTKVTKKNENNLRIAAYPSISRHLLPHFTKSFMEDNPGININVYVGVENIPKWLDDDTIDFAIGERGIVENNKWIFLTDNEVNVAVPASSPFHTGKAVSLDLLEEYPVLLAKYNPRSAGTEILKEWVTKKPVHSIDVTCPDGSVLLAMVGEGLGITFLTSIYKYECPNTVRLLPLDPPLMREIGIIMKPNKKLTPIMSKFIERLQKNSTIF